MPPRQRHPLFDQSDARANFDDWVKTDRWRPEEAAAISLGFEPRYINTDTVKPYLKSSLDADAFDRRLLNVTRAIEKGTLPVLFGPIEFFRWATGNELQLPAALVEAITRLLSLRQPEAPELAALRVEIANLKRELERATTADRDLRPRERRSFQVMIAGMATKYGFDPNADRNSAVANIVGDIQLIGLSIDKDTVLTHLRSAHSDLEIQLPKP